MCSSPVPPSMLSVIDFFSRTGPEPSPICVIDRDSVF
jgi:hypothetical protein